MSPADPVEAGIPVEPAEPVEPVEPVEPEVALPVVTTPVVAGTANTVQ